MCCDVLGHIQSPTLKTHPQCSSSMLTLNLHIAYLVKGQHLSDKLASVLHGNAHLVVDLFEV